MTEEKIQRINNSIKIDCILLAASGDKIGEIELLWQPVNEARSYIVQINSISGSEKTWKHSDIVTRTRYTATGLKSGKMYYFRIAPITANGQQEWSEPVVQKAS
ncbi:MAG: fibronectin type III domain-containing protein [Ignavibacteria bacterium]|nr:fibronectin type III domain-containing protein [Ignavibacteria bacterium]